MVKYKAYPKYKESGIDWIGDVPEGWELSEVKWLYNRKKITNSIEKELLSVYRDYGVIPKSSRSDNNNKESEDLTPYQLVEVGDLVTNKMKAWQGSIAISEYEGIVSPAYYVYKSCHNNHNKYLHYLFRSKPYILYYGVISKGIRVNQWDLEHEAFRLTQVVIPSLTEQQAIANFLDRETTHIDALIAKKERSIELLKEKRQATITHAVTKGLNPQAKMKDSGIEWIGEVPEGWRVLQFGKLATVKQNLVSPFDYSDSFQIAPEHIEKSTGKLLSQKKVFEMDIISNNNKFHLGDILYCKIRPNLNKVIIAPFDGICSAEIYPIRTSENTKYIFYTLLSESFLAQVKLVIMNRVKMPKINQVELSRIIIPNPPLQEQQAIADYLDAQCAKIDTLISKTQHSIELLKEKRQALITAAVTGKIDVREAVC